MPISRARAAATRLALLALTLAAAAVVTLGAGVAPSEASPRKAEAAQPATSLSAPTRTGSIDAAAGGMHACVILGGGSLQCWGADDDGQATPPSGAFVEVTAGYEFSCAIRNDGTPADGGPIVCWGDDSSGQATPPAGGDFDQIEASSYAACARHSSDWTLSCWGGIADTSPAGAFSSFDIGNNHRCGIASLALVCWGHDYGGRVSQPNADDRQFSEVTVGWDHTCAILSADHSIVCWGANGAGAPSGEFRSIEAVADGTCAIGWSSREMSCWGGGPGAVSGQVTLLDSGTYGYCIIRSDTYAGCWPGLEPTASGSSLAGATVGVPYDAPLPITHISPAPSYTVTGMPAGLSVVGDRVVGTPTGAPGSTTVHLEGAGAPVLLDFSFGITVSPGALASVVLTPSADTADTEQTVSLAVEGFDAYGNSLGLITEQAAFTSSYPADEFDGGDVTFAFDPDSVATGVRTHTLTATLPGGITGDAYVEVNPLITRLRLTLTPDTLVVHGPVATRLDGLDAEGTARVDLSPLAVVTSSVADDIVGFLRVTPETVGTRTITAEYQGLTTTAQLTATAGPVASLAVEVSDERAVGGDAVTVTAWGFDAYGNPLGDVTDSATVTSDVAGDVIRGDEVVFAFDPAAAVTTEVVHTITATIGAVSGDAAVAVAPIVADLELRVSSRAATVGDTVILTVIARDADGEQLADVSDHLRVTSDQPEDVVSGNTVRFTHASPHLITARYGTLAASVLVEVSPRPEVLGATGVESALVPLGLVLLGFGAAVVVAVRLRVRR